MPETPLQIMCNVVDRIESDLERLKAIEEIIKRQPQWLEQVPELKQLVKTSA